MSFDPVPASGGSRPNHRAATSVAQLAGLEFPGGVICQPFPDALRIGREHGGTIDLLLTDVKMPGMNGHELADELQAVRPEMQVLYVSGARDATVSKLNTEAVNFLAKPFTPDALVAKVNSLFQA